MLMRHPAPHQTLLLQELEVNSIMISDTGNFIRPTSNQHDAGRHLELHSQLV
jgi:hypothetical protein